MTDWCNEETIIADIREGTDSISAILDKHIPNINRMERETWWRRIWSIIHNSPMIYADGKVRYQHTTSGGLSYRRRKVIRYAVRESIE